MEIFKDVIGYEGLYQVSNIGRVKSLRRFNILKPNDNGNGYLKLTLCKNGGVITKNVHQLVAQSFLGLSTLAIDHINGNKKDNRVDNLQYVTDRENQTRAYQRKRSLPTGVRKLHDSRYRSLIYHNKLTIHLGYFKTIQDASKAYKSKLKQIQNGTI